jgi:uncharacterized protein YidB (DUF937 family)
MGLMDDLLGKAAGAVMGGKGGAGGDALGGLLGQLGGGGGALGQVLGSLGGQGGQGGQQWLQMGLQLLQQQGGLPALLSKLKGAGLGPQVDSWVGTGANLPVSPAQIQQALGGAGGGNILGQLASQMGVSTDQAGGALSKLLPELVNQMTPGGSVPDNHGDLLSGALGMLRGR